VDILFLRKTLFQHHVQNNPEHWSSRLIVKQVG